MRWPGPVRPLQSNESLFPLSRCGRAAGNGRLITSLIGKGRQNHKFSSQRNRGGIVLVLMEIHAGGNQGGGG